jgi:hypothetical protein
MILVRLTVMAIILGAVLFGTAGRLDVWGFWAWLAVVWVSTGATFTLLGRVNPGLVQERLRPPSDRDRATRRLGALPFLTYLALAGLDARFGWSVVPPWLQLAGLALLPVVGLFLRRTALEDRMLREELQGYQAYAARVRWRVIPGVY